MEKVLLFINKLQELVNEEAHPKVLLAVAQMLVSELETMDTSPIPSRISVIMPKKMAPEVDFLKYKEVAAAPIVKPQIVEEKPIVLQESQPQIEAVIEKEVVAESPLEDVDIQPEIPTETFIAPIIEEIAELTSTDEVIEAAPEKSIHDILRETIENNKGAFNHIDEVPSENSEPIAFDETEDYSEINEVANDIVIPFSEEDMIASPNEPSFPAFTQTFLTSNISEEEVVEEDELPTESIDLNLNNLNDAHVSDFTTSVIEDSSNIIDEELPTKEDTTSGATINETIAAPAKTIHELLMETIAEAKRTIHDSHLEKTNSNETTSYINPVFEESIFSTPANDETSVGINDEPAISDNYDVAETIPAVEIPTPLPLPEQELIARNENHYNLTDIEIPTLSQIDAINNHQEQYNYESSLNTNDETPTINTAFNENKQEVSHILENTHIKDLKKAIGINDKYLFINELFNGDENLYEKSIKHIQHFSIYAEATFWIQKELKTKLHWQNNSYTVELFDQLVKRRFS